MIFDEEKENGETEEPEAAAEETPEAEEGQEPEPEAEAETADEAPEADDAPDAEADGADANADGEPSEASEPAPPAKPTRKKRTREEKLERRARRKRKRIAARADKRKPIVRLPKPERPRAARKERVGVVVSDAMNRTITVRVERAFPHPRYGKVVRRSRTFAVHDAENTAGVGDRVRIVETRPLSKTKRWRLAEVLEVAR